MRNPRVLFLHGWKSVVGGVKPTYLSEHGCEVINPKLDDDDFASALATAQAAYDMHHPDVIVGSSRGGAVAMNIHSGKTPLVLLCPAWKKWGTVDRLQQPTMILHSRNDDIIPWVDSIELVERSQSEYVVWQEVGNDHRLADPSSLEVMLWAVHLLANGSPLPESSPWELDEPGNASRAVGTEASYLCDSCGEEIIIPLDPTEGMQQVYVEDCPVCCNANIIHVALDEHGNAHVWAEPEQDKDA